LKLLRLTIVILLIAVIILSFERWRMKVNPEIKLITIPLNSIQKYDEIDLYRAFKEGQKHCFESEKTKKQIDSILQIK
jgi:hypothetical protein